MKICSVGIAATGMNTKSNLMTAFAVFLYPMSYAASNNLLSWCYINRTDTKKPGKLPYNPLTHEAAQSNNSQTWASICEATRAYQNGNYAGIGFMFSDSDPYTGIDLDRCRDLETGQIEEWAQGIIKRMNSYAEITPSGTGVHILIKAKLTGAGVKRAVDGHEIEIYDRARYFTMTGEHIPETPTTIQERQDYIIELYEQVKQAHNSTSRKANTDEEIISKAKSNKKIGAKFCALFDGKTEAHTSTSEADMALCGIIARYTTDPEQIERIARQSRLHRPNGTNGDYLRRTISKAIANSRE